MPMPCSNGEVERIDLLAVGNQRAHADLGKLIRQTAGLVAKTSETGVHLLHRFHPAAPRPVSMNREKPAQRILRAIRSKESKWRTLSENAAPFDARTHAGIVRIDGGTDDRDVFQPKAERRAQNRAQIAAVAGMMEHDMRAVLVKPPSAFL